MVEIIERLRLISAIHRTQIYNVGIILTLFDSNNVCIKKTLPFNNFIASVHSS